jgi:hypothetical protein
MKGRPLNPNEGVEEELAGTKSKISGYLRELEYGA